MQTTIFYYLFLCYEDAHNNDKDNYLIRSVQDALVQHIKGIFRAAYSTEMLRRKRAACIVIAVVEWRCGIATLNFHFYYLRIFSGNLREIDQQVLSAALRVETHQCQLKGVKCSMGASRALGHRTYCRTATIGNVTVDSNVPLQQLNARGVPSTACLPLRPESRCTH